MNADGTQMNADGAREKLNSISHAIIGAAQKVSTKLGCGFLEKVYENSLLVELRKSGVTVGQQQCIHVYYEGEIVGVYVPDLLVEDAVIVEIKAVSALDAIHRLQCLNYLKATGNTLALVLNFGRPHLEVGRVVWHF
jgi:GxxExxY protein